MEYISSLCIVCIAIASYGVGVLRGYAYHEYKNQNRFDIMNIEVLEENGQLLAYEMITNKFLGQSTTIEDLVNKLKSSFPEHNLVISRSVDEAV